MQVCIAFWAAVVVMIVDFEIANGTVPPVVRIVVLAAASLLIGTPVKGVVLRTGHNALPDPGGEDHSRAAHLVDPILALPRNR